MAAALAVKAAPAVLGAAAELLRALLIAAAVLLGAAATGVVAFIASRWHRHPDATRATALPPRTVARAAQPLPGARPAIERPHEVHLHLHGVTAADIAAILRRQNQP